jgi:hypothetical protein
MIQYTPGEWCEQDDLVHPEKCCTGTSERNPASGASIGTARKYNLIPPQWNTQYNMFHRKRGELGTGSPLQRRGCLSTYSRYIWNPLPEIQDVSLLVHGFIDDMAWIREL